MKQRLRAFWMEHCPFIVPMTAFVVMMVPVIIISAHGTGGCP